MHIQQFHRRIFLQVFSQFGDINIHAAGVEIAVVLPDAVKRHAAVENVVGVFA